VRFDQATDGSGRRHSVRRRHDRWRCGVTDSHTTARDLLPSRAARATVSGSFRRAMSGVQEAVYTLTDLGVDVLSPADPRVVDQLGDFLFVASDSVRAVRLVQSRHLAAIGASDFVWLVAPDGYIGQSAAMEIGYAVAVGTPVYSRDVPSDLTLQQYVRSAASVRDAVGHSEATRDSREPQPDDILLDPYRAIERVHADVDALARELRSRGAGGAAARAASRVREQLRLSSLH
jgi:hypothetical protein